MTVRRRTKKEIKMDGDIADIGAEIVTAIGIHGTADARIPGPAARDGATIETMILNLETAIAATKRDDEIT
jgi:hypothetical protein